MVAIPEAVDSDFWRADATRADSADVALRFPVLADVLLQQRFVLLSVFKWEHRKGCRHHRLDISKNYKSWYL